MAHQTSPLNGDFGICIEDVTQADLADDAFQRNAYDLWVRHGGLLAVRGDDLAALPPAALIQWAGVFGMVETECHAAREDKMVAGFPILRIGNVRNDAGKPVAQSEHTILIKERPIVTTMI